MKTFWLSFVDPDRPTGSRFLGVSVVDITPEMETEALLDFPEMVDLERGPEVIAAARRARALDCNPGGEVAAIEVRTPIEAVYKNRLLSMKDLQEAGLV